MQELLSQEEIDALLHGVDEGEVEVEYGVPAADVQEYDLSTQDRVVRGRMPSLERANERFARHLRTGFRGLLRRGLEVGYDGMQIQKFGEYFTNLLVPTSINVVRLQPLPGLALIVMDAQLVFLLVDNFFGGGRFNAKVEGREFTPSETLVVDRALETVFGELQKAWGVLAAIKVQLLQKEASADATTSYNPNDIAVISSFSVDFDVSGGKLHLVVPYGMIEPIRELLDRSSVTEADARDSRWEAALKENIKDAMIDLRCKVAETEISLREVIDLDVGDVIPIEIPQPVLRADTIPLFSVRLGTLKGNLALQVLNKIDRPG
ncbi:MAG: flagellar motor switch protein FliM [Gammaproteobacteria bacterium]|nr:flagellar motor switch protein FliM [Gammaproteobacteria bacterium]MBP6052155.1 flagellar motor switch protein FliM [Pseudomonadales bacterium]MBK6582216.1 flagellar motor switch protein FliM [Gammaproteobacteria bacterium]MBK7521510.1 flagellar motor switch protein FliM [Gammaproteobacteria bacterium]MBK7729285.1 flagellar motor switch protein FliM [Gammaproteobacteria bacterium]